MTVKQPDPNENEQQVQAEEAKLTRLKRTVEESKTAKRPDSDKQVDKQELLEQNQKIAKQDVEGKSDDE